MLGRIETPSLYFSRIGNTGSRRRFSFVPDGRSRPSWTQLQCLVANEQSPGLLSLQLRSPRFSNYGCQPGPRRILSDFEVLTTVRTSSWENRPNGSRNPQVLCSKGFANVERREYCYEEGCARGVSNTLRLPGKESIVTKRVALGEIRGEWHSRKDNLLLANCLVQSHTFNIDPNLPHEVGMFVAHRILK